MLPKHLGGLGFRDVRLFNQALIAKIAWRLITKPECLLSCILLEKYCHNASFLKVAPAASSSHGWKGILWGKELLLDHLGKAIGDGDSTRVWTDSWICTSSDLKPSGPILPQHQDLLVSDLLSRETKEWNRALIDDLLPELSEHITSIRPSLLGAADAFIWTQSNSGIYSA